MIDINIINTDNDNVDFQVVGSTVSGIQLLAQRVLITLLTQTTDYLREQEGGSLLTGLGSSVCDTEYAKLVLISALANVKSIFKNDYNTPDDETLDDIVIQDVGLESDRIYFTIIVKSKSGSYQVLTSTLGSTV